MRKPKSHNSSKQRTRVAKLLQLSRPNRRVSNIVRTWWAMRSQKRRRKQAAPVPPVPVITDATMQWDATEMALADVQLTLQIDYGSFPVASVEVFVRHDEGAPASLGTVPSSDLGFYHPRASSGGETLYYKVRYVFEDYGGPVIGAFSPEYPIFIDTY